jgi:ribonuclease P protein component
MLSKNRRITSQREWNTIHKCGRGVHSTEMVVKFMKNKLAISRFGFIVGTKVDKKANKRNLIKRRLRTIIKDNLKKINMGYDIIFITRPGIVEKSYQEIEIKVIRLLKRAKLIK